MKASILRVRGHGRAGVKGRAFRQFVWRVSSANHGCSSKQPLTPVCQDPPTKPKHGRPRKARATFDTTGRRRGLNEPKRFVFTEKSGVILKMPDDAKPKDFFQIFFNDKILDMVTKTKEHATVIINRSRPSRHTSRMNSWYYTTRKEMRKFIGLI